MNNSRFLKNAAIAAAGVSICFAAQAADETIEFNRDVRPILSDKCFACHGFDAKKRKANLRLDTAEGATAEHDGERAIVPRDLKKSELWARINSDDKDEVMPPPESHKTLSAAEKATLKKWIEQGAKYQLHWAFEPIRKPEVPKISDEKLAGKINEIDAFLLTRLKKEGLSFSPEADKPTLIRRVAFALTGLPPTISEVDDFLNDSAPDAYAKMVEHFLTSPRYGEEMARHWLDVARYADTHGLHLDNEREMWAYRDWVIGAFNKNERFDQFTIEQLAGDLLPNATREQIVATGFNRCNVTTSEGGAIAEEFLFRYAVDRTVTAVEAWMGLTAGCAVCHDHKFDPISTREFYSMYALFYSNADPAMDGNAMRTMPTLRLGTPEQEKKLAQFDKLIGEKQSALDEKLKVAAANYKDPATLDPRPPLEETEVVWMEDDFPKGAKMQHAGSAGEWIVPDESIGTAGGKKVLKRKGTAMSQDFFTSGTPPFEIPPEGEFFVYVYLDPADPPKAVMIQFHKGGWNRRAVWGDYDAIQFGAPKEPERVNMGPLPDASKWVRLEVPAEKVDLKAGDQITGFALTQFGGTVYWDKFGVTGRSDPAADPTRSFLAWWKSRAGKDTQGVEKSLNKILKDGPDKAHKEADRNKLRDYFLENICIETKQELGPMLADLNKTKNEREEFDKKVPTTFVFNDLKEPRDAFVMVRGQYDKKGDKVEPGTPAILPPLKKENPNGRATRLDFARWLVSPEHPLTARVTVNRFWQQFFGVGLVKTSADFGSQGEPPVNPELLDWLAANFRDNGWDVKALVRLMVNSAAFKQSSRVTPELLARDPENRLLARGPRFRLDAEQIRDNALFVSGLIDLTMGGKGVKPYQPPNIWEPVGFVGSNTRFYKQDHGNALYRRSIYTFLKRTAPAPFLANFDAPNREQFCTRRERSNTPLQALQLMNDTQHIEAARALAERMLSEGGSKPADRIAFAYRTVLARKPDADELEIVQRELATHLDRYKADPDAAKKTIAHGESKPKCNAPPEELASYTLVANMILNLDETLNRN